MQESFRRWYFPSPPLADIYFYLSLKTCTTKAGNERLFQQLQVVWIYLLAHRLLHATGRPSGRGPLNSVCITKSTRKSQINVSSFWGRDSSGCGYLVGGWILSPALGKPWQGSCVRESRLCIWKAGDQKEGSGQYLRQTCHSWGLHHCLSGCVCVCTFLGFPFWST